MHKRQNFQQYINTTADKVILLYSSESSVLYRYSHLETEERQSTTLFK